MRPTSCLALPVALLLAPAAAVAAGGGAATEVRGRVSDGKVKGRAKHSLGVCRGDTAFKGTKR